MAMVAVKKNPRIFSQTRREKGVVNHVYSASLTANHVPFLHFARGTNFGNLVKIDPNLCDIHGGALQFPQCYPVLIGFDVNFR